MSDPDPPKRFRGVWSMWPAVLGVASHFVLREVLDPWLNGASDAKFWSAAVIVAAPLVFTVVALVRAIAAPSSR